MHDSDMDLTMILSLSKLRKLITYQSIIFGLELTSFILPILFFCLSKIFSKLISQFMVLVQHFRQVNKLEGAKLFYFYSIFQVSLIFQMVLIDI